MSDGRDQGAAYWSWMTEHYERAADDDSRHQRNGHTLELRGCMWKCLQCDHVFDAAVDAEAFWCGDPCTCPSRIVVT